MGAEVKPRERRISESTRNRLFHLYAAWIQLTLSTFLPPSSHLKKRSACLLLYQVYYVALNVYRRATHYIMHLIQIITLVVSTLTFCIVFNSNATT